jgi:Tfp pilus assembly protein PilP
VRLKKNVKATLMLTVLSLLPFAGCGEEEPAAPTPAQQEGRRAQMRERMAKKQAAEAQAVQAETTVAAVYSYDSKGKRDPFRSFIWDPPDESAEIRGPLEQYDVAQLSLMAVVWSTGNARALVIDPAGQSFIIGKGTRVGKNSGEVTRIEDNLVVVKETYVDFTGQKTTKDVEMRIRVSEGG